MSMIRTLLGYVGEYKKDSILTPLFMIIEVTMEVLIPYVTASIIDDGIQAGNLSHVFAYGGLMLLLAMCSLLGGILSARYGASASTGFAKNIRQAMYEKVQTFSFSNIDKFSTAGLITRMTTDVTNLQNAYMMLLRIAVRAPLMLIFSFVMCFVIHARLALIFLGFMALLALFLFFVMRKTIPMFRKVFERYDDLNASVQENVSAIRVVKAFVREEYENDKFTKAATNLADLFIRVEKIMVAFSPVMSLAIYGCMLSLGWFGAHFIVQGTLTTGNLTSLFTYVMQMLGSLMMLSMIFVMITMSTASANRIAEVLQETPDLADPENPVTEVADGSIDFDHVSFAYHSGTGEDTLHDIDLHIKSGETIGVIGGTGSGKSTLVSLISRLYDVTDGAVRVGGVDVRQYDMEALRNPRESPLGQAGRDAGGMPRGLPSCLRGRIRPAAAGRVRHRRRAGRRERLRRPAPETVHRPRAPEKTEGAHSGRLHLRRRHGDGRVHPRGLPRAHPRHDEAHHLPAHLLRAGRRPRPRAGAGQGLGLRHARKPAGDQRHL